MPAFVPAFVQPPAPEAVQANCQRAAGLLYLDRPVHYWNVFKAAFADLRQYAAALVLRRKKGNETFKTVLAKAPAGFYFN